MQDEEIITEESLTGGEQNVPPAVGEPAVSEISDLSLQELNQSLGKQFPTKEAALKSIRDTFSYVGRKAQPTPQVDTNQFVSKSEFEEATLYARKPELEPHKELISALAMKYGKSASEVVEMDVFKTTFEKVKTADAIEQSKSVLHTNPRLGQVTDKITQARDALKAGDAGTARNSAVAAVLGAYEA